VPSKARSLRHKSVESSGVKLLPGILDKNIANTKQRSSLNAKQRELFDAIHEEFSDLTAQEINWLTPAILDTYVNARSTLKEQTSILKEAMQWRIQNRDLLADLICPRCSVNPLSHDARCFGVDPEGDLVFMNCFALPRDFNPSGIAQHMACVFERSLRAYPLAKKWTWIIHMHGFGLKNLDPRTSIKLLHLLQVAYRDRLKRAIVLDAPVMFGRSWSVIQPFIKEKTAKSIHFDTWPAVREELFESLGPAIANRLCSEIEENKDPSRAKEKTWTTFWGIGPPEEEPLSPTDSNRSFRGQPVRKWRPEPGANALFV